MIVDVVVEIPKGSRNKVEWDVADGVFRLSRVLPSSVRYPIEYGYLPGSVAPDEDPLDILVLMAEPTFTGCHIHVRPVGVLKIVDDGKQDDKILCVVEADTLKELGQVPITTLNEIEHFFQVYKKLESKKVKVQGWEGRSVAEGIVDRCRQRFNTDNYLKGDACQ